jgi:hypothetical protein
MQIARTYGSRRASSRLHLIDLAVAAAPDDKAAHLAGAKIYAARALDSRSTMAHGIFRAAAVESAAKAGIAPPDDPRRF